MVSKEVILNFLTRIKPQSPRKNSRADEESPLLVLPIINISVSCSDVVIIHPEGILNNLTHSPQQTGENINEIVSVVSRVSFFI
jgi:hypothetical protein